MITTRRRLVLLVVLAAILIAVALPASAGAYVYWSNIYGGGSIGRANNDGSEANPHFIGETPGSGIAVDSSHIYYRGETGAVRANLDGGEATPLSLGFSTSPAAVDGGHIYWLTGSGIGRAKLDGTEAEPDFIEEIEADAIDIAVYGDYVYWGDYLGGFGSTVGRANLSTKVVEPEFATIGFPGGGPAGIAVDEDGVFWIDEPSGGTETIGHVGLGGGPAALDYIPGAHVKPFGIAVQGSDLYWESYDGSEETIAHAELEFLGNGETHAVAVDESFIGLGFFESHWLAVNAPTSPPPPPPPPPPSSSSSSGVSTPAPVAAAPTAVPLAAPKCKKGFKKQTVKGKAKCVAIKKHRKHHHRHRKHRHGHH